MGEPARARQDDRAALPGCRAADLPVARTDDGLASVKVIAGEALGVSARVQTRTPILYFDVTVQPGGRVELAAPAAFNVAVYVYDGEARVADDTLAQSGTFALLGAGDRVVIACAPDAAGPARALVLGGEPLNEPVARYGPFVMNTEAGDSPGVRRLPRRPLRRHRSLKDSRGIRPRAALAVRRVVRRRQRPAAAARPADPAVPTMMVAARWPGAGRISGAGAFAISVLASLVADLAWFWAGRPFGYPVLRFLCRVSLSPDTCVRQTEGIFERWGFFSVVISKFVPGFSTVGAADRRARCACPSRRSSSHPWRARRCGSASRWRRASCSRRRSTRS
jgi:hypothetical protein